jgi:hypothetical protein
MASSLMSFLDHTQRRTTVSRIPLDEWSVHRRFLYLTTHNTLNRQTSMTPVGFEPTISTGERAQNYTLDGAATGTGKGFFWVALFRLSSEAQPLENLILHTFGAMSNTQVRFMPTYCALYAIYKLLQHVSANVCIDLHRVHKAVMFSYE